MAVSPSSVAFGAMPTITVSEKTPAGGLPTSVRVKMDNTSLAAADFTYNSTTGAIVFAVTVNGNILIETDYSVSIDNPRINVTPGEVHFNDMPTLTIVNPVLATNLPVGITITMNGDTMPPTDYTYNNMAGTIAFSVGVYGNVFIATFYHVTLVDAPGAGGSGSTTVKYGSNIGAVAIPIYNGHTFDGYFDGVGGTGTQFVTAKGVGNRAWDLTNATLYAKWTSTPDPDPVTNYYITATADPGSTISPAGTVTVKGGTNITFSFAAKEGNVISAVLVDGVLVTERVLSGTYTFADVHANHTIKVSTRSVRTDISLKIDVMEGHGHAEYSINGGAFITYTTVVSLPELCSLEVRAYAADGSTFVKWVEDGTEYTTEELSYGSVDASISLKLYFSDESNNSFPFIAGSISLLLLLALLLLFLLLYRRNYDVIKIGGANIIGDDRVRRKHAYRFSIGGGYSGTVVYRIGDNGEWMPLTAGPDGVYEIHKGVITDNVTIECR